MQMWHMMTWINNEKKKESALQKWHFTLAISSFLLWEGSVSFGSTCTSHDGRMQRSFLVFGDFYGGSRDVSLPKPYEIYGLTLGLLLVASKPSKDDLRHLNRCPNHLWLVTRMQTQLPLYYTRTLWPMAMDLEPLILQTPLIPWEVLQR